jgi:hypothetical protein
MKRLAIITGLLMGMTFVCPYSQAGQPKTLTRQIDGLVITGELLPGVLGERLERICVLAEQEGSLDPVTFQIDELTPDRSEYILPEGPEPNTDKSDRVLSPQDEIVLMVKDLGDQVEPEGWPEDAEKVVEVEVIDPLDGTRAWCYVACMDSLPDLPEKDYVTWDEDKQEIRTSMYINGYPLGRNAIYFTRVIGVPPEGGTGVDFMDRMKTRFQFEALWGLITFEANEDDAGQRVVRGKDGPVRVFRKGVVYYQLPFGIKYNASGTLQIYWESFAHGPVEVRIPAGVTRVLRNAWLRGTTDFAPEALGMIFFSDKDKEGVIIDGEMSEKEKQLDFNNINWRCVTGDVGSICGRELTTAPRLPLEDKYDYWVDDISREQPPEDHPGMMGCLVETLDMSALPPGLSRYAGLVYTPPANIKPDQVKPYLDIEDHPLVLKIGGRLGRSNILPWHPELPDDYYINYQPLPGEIKLGSSEL